MAIYKNAFPVYMNGAKVYLDGANPKSYPGNGTSWKDISGNNNHCTLMNGPVYNSLNGGSIYLDGIDDYIVWNTSDSLKWQNWSKITIEIAFKLASHTGVGGSVGNVIRQYIADFRDVGGTSGALGILYDNAVTGNGTSTPGLKLFYNITNSTWEETVAVSSLTINSIYYFQATFDKSTSTNNIRYWVNGVNTFNKSIAITANNTNTGKIYLGTYSDVVGFPNTYKWNGNIYLFRAYPNVILTDAQLKQNFNAQRMRFKL